MANIIFAEGAKSERLETPLADGSAYAMMGHMSRNVVSRHYPRRKEQTDRLALLFAVPISGRVLVRRAGHVRLLHALDGVVDEPLGTALSKVSLQDFVAHVRALSEMSSTCQYCRKDARVVAWPITAMLFVKEHTGIDTRKRITKR